MTKSELEKYSNAPEGLDTEGVLRLFDELLTMPQPVNSDDATTMAEALWQVADRQWHTYSVLDSQTKRRLDNWIIVNWDPQSIKMTNWLLGVIGNIGLTDSLQHMQRALEKNEVSIAVREEILNAMKEFGNNIEDPYAKLRKRNE